MTFQAVTQDSPGHGAPVDAKIYVGDYEARVTQIADTIAANDPAVTPSNLDATALFVATHDRRGDGHNLQGGRNDHGKGPDRTARTGTGTTTAPATTSSPARPATATSGSGSTTCGR